MSHPGVTTGPAGQDRVPTTLAEILGGTRPEFGTPRLLVPDHLPRTLAALFDMRVREQGGEPFLKCGGDWVTWAEIDAITDRVAAGLAALGIVKGDRVGYLSMTSMPMLETYFALMKLGAVQIPMNVFLKGEFLRFQLAHSRVSTVVVDRVGLGSVARVIGDLPDVRRVIVLEDAPDAEVTTEAVEVCRFSEIRSSDGMFEPPEILPADLFQVMYSSGTTGNPKGCMISNRHALRISASVSRFFGSTKDDVYYVPWALNHVSGLVGPLQALLGGVRVIMAPHLEVDGLMETLAKEGVTMVTLLGPVPAALLAQPTSEWDRNHSVRAVQCAPAPLDLQIALEERFGFAVNAEVYGQSECCNILTSPITGGSRKRETNGRPMPDLEVILLDDEGRPVRTGTPGEICIRPLTDDAMFDGYLDDPAATLAAIDAMWFHTGDVAVSDADGFMTFVDRKKDMMRRSGENISSFEMEKVLRAHPLVLNVAVHETSAVMSHSNDVVAWLVLESGAVLDPQEFAEYLWENVPYYAVPRFIRFAAELPLTASGRVEKYKLREIALDGHDFWDLKAMGLLTPADRRR
jgi:crotonobetaine/carnitine-CoA ligase